MKRKVFRGRGQTGFSLIDALIAAVVLGIGLLALAALQASVTRNAADSRARSQVMAFVEQIVERQRAYGVSGNFALVPLASLWTTAEVTAAQNAAGVSNLNLAMTATHYDGRTGSFVVTTSALPASAPQYKILRSVATWTDASGQARRIDLASVLSPRVISSSRLPYNVATGGSGSTAARPIIRTGSPVEAGMIPIALGNGSSTASTNPKPEVGNDAHVSETRFNVINYAAINNSTNVTLQSKVETTVVGCTCNTATANASDTALRPTYWDGVRYAPPKTASYAPLAGRAVPTVVKGKPSFSPESPLCDVCCRDHHDPTGVSGPKFSPLRTSHDHYSISAGSYTTVTSGVYQDACRLIRVDGFWRVAADLSNNYFNLLEARNDTSATPWVPTDSATTNYQRLVAGNGNTPGFIDYKITSRTSGYNTPVAAADISGAGGLEQVNSINNPAYIPLARTNDSKWLHSRGLYIDHLEADAIAKINEIKARDACKTSLAAMRACLLPYIPFTSINLTELTRWSPVGGVQLNIPNGLFVDASLTANAAPVRGKVFPGSNPTANSDQTGTAEIFYSNSGLAALLYAAVEAENNSANTLKDTQVFRFGTGGGGGGSGGNYKIEFGDYEGRPEEEYADQFVFPSNTDSYPKFADDAGSVCSSGNPAATCTNQILPRLNVKLTMNNYNRVALGSFTKAGSLTCSPASTARNLGNQASTGGSYPITKCQNYRVSNASVYSSLGIKIADAYSISTPSPDNGATSESTDMWFTNVDATNKIVITMKDQGQSERTGTTCTYTTKCTASPNCNGSRDINSNYAVDKFVYVTQTCN